MMVLFVDQMDMSRVTTWQQAKLCPLRSIMTKMTINRFLRKPDLLCTLRVDFQYMGYHVLFGE